MTVDDIPDLTLEELKEKDVDNDLNYKAIEKIDENIEIFERASAEAEMIAAWLRKVRDSQITLREYERRIEEYEEEHSDWAVDKI